MRKLVKKKVERHSRTGGREANEDLTTFHLHKLLPDSDRRTAVSVAQFNRNDPIRPTTHEDSLRPFYETSWDQRLEGLNCVLELGERSAFIETKRVRNGVPLAG